MAVQTRVKPNKVDAPKNDRHAGLSRDFLIKIYRAMYMSRRLDDKEIQLKRQNKIYFQISSAGHEAVTAAMGLLLRPGVDWLYPYYRDRAFCLLMGVTPLDMLLQAVGAKDDPSSGGRQMPSHWGHPKYNIVSKSSCTGTQFVQAIGAAEATQYFEAHPKALAQAKKAPLGDLARYDSDEIVYVSSGDGATSEGEFWESLNVSCAKKLPIVYLVEDNGYAISVPIEVQTAGGSISKLTQGYPGLHISECDGTDPIESYRVCKEAVEFARERKGPALIHAHVTRPYSHSLSDDEKLYKVPEEREEEAHRDPVSKFSLFLIREGILDQKQIEALESQVDHEVRHAADEALVAEPPTVDSIHVNVYSPDVDPTSSAFEATPQLQGAQKTMVEMVSATLSDEMSRDERITVFGEDVADCSREENLKEVKGKGGVFKATAGLQRKYGSARVFNTPLAEAAIIGRAIGMATRGLKPVPEIQFFDYIWPAMMQIRNELSNLRWRSNNAFSAPLVIRTAYGGYLQGGAPYHSQCGESIFAHCPGIRVVIPSNAMDANGLMRTAIRCEDPVLYLEHKHLYRQPYAKSPYPGPDYTVPFGRARVVREGSDVTLVTYGALVQRSYLAAQEAAEQGVQVEVLDLRTIQPLDFESIARSVQKTGRVIVAHEDTLSCGFGAEIAARIAGELFEHLDAPIRRVGAKNVPVAYCPDLEEAILPQSADILKAIRDTARY
jgi:2-oxoisovalerate dehydrogenase E1 component